MIEVAISLATKFGTLGLVKCKFPFENGLCGLHRSRKTFLLDFKNLIKVLIPIKIDIGIGRLHIQSTFELYGSHRSQNTFLQIFVLPSIVTK